MTPLEPDLADATAAASAAIVRFEITLERHQALARITNGDAGPILDERYAADLSNARACAKRFLDLTGDG